MFIIKKLSSLIVFRCEVSKTPFFIKPFCKEYIECTNTNGLDYTICVSTVLHFRLNSVAFHTLK